MAQEGNKICNTNLTRFSFGQIMINGGITELLFTSDNHSGLKKEFLTLQNGKYHHAANLNSNNVQYALYCRGQIEKKRSVFWKVFSDVLCIFISVLKTINVDVQPNVKQELSYLQEIQVKLWY